MEITIYILDEELMPKKVTAYPVTRKGWRDYYIREYNKTPTESLAILAMWYDFMYMGLGDT
jgi:hypothetical protein